MLSLTISEVVEVRRDEWELTLQMAMVGGEEEDEDQVATPL